MKKSWEIVTRTLGLEMGCKLNIDLDERKLVEDLDRVVRALNLRDYYLEVPFHQERWKFISLVNLEGRHDVDLYTTDGKSNPSLYKETEAMQYCPYIKSVLDETGCRTNRVRILSLEPGGVVAWHHEYGRSLSAGLARCHIPIRTHSDTFVQIGHQKFTWRPGEIWWGDFAFPHCGRNFGDIPRTYVVADFVIEDAFRKWVPEKYFVQSSGSKKKMARNLCYQLYRFDRNPRALMESKIKGIARKMFPDLYGRLKARKSRSAETSKGSPI